MSPDAKVGFGHVRLSIVDLSPGNQPFIDTKDKTVTTTTTTTTTTNMVSPSKGSGNIIDIGTSTAHDTVESQEKQVLQQRLLKQQDGKRWLPTALIWEDESAHRLWWEANTLDEFYSIRDEVNLLKRWEQEIARQVLDHSVLIDLGYGPSGINRPMDVTKVVPLLNELERNGKHVHYYTLDISRKALENVLAKLPTSYKVVKYTELWGTFDNLRAWRGNIQKPKWFLTLGSIFGNDEFQIAINELKKLVLGHEWYRPEDWEVIGRHFAPGEEIVTNGWYKYSPNEMQKQFGGVGFPILGNGSCPLGWFMITSWPWLDFILLTVEMGS
ncbi:hypothetical protein F9C07_2286874 [Aspergillus flavus]|uniref:Histidine-specific methyltransferase SAM-dependent domain-containing protein n=2 Tax=Aspergillus flavus TaxID=5059 RepID=A0A7U2R137_ASPFN|nr:hypothetical protein F9C07_2286874 [Aspergillus flavus]